MSGPAPYRFENPVLELECFRLLQLVYASRPMHERLVQLRDNAKAGRISYTAPGSLLSLQRWEEVEANRILLNLAVVIRNGLDHTPLLRGEDAVCSLCRTARVPFKGRRPHPFPETPRQIWLEFGKQGVPDEALGIRDTCNKIIHADEIGFERVALRERSGSHVTDQIFASGTRGKTEWTVGIWVPEFCDGILTMEVIDDIPW